MATKYKGVVVYEILPDGCLNGVHSNDHQNTKNEIFNEIARKIIKDDSRINVVEGDYICCYIDLANEPYICDLIISNNNGRYDLIWHERNQPTVIKFKGTGWCTRKDQLTVRYENA